ncbi:MAG: DNA mismatch endonuclease Vsr [Desulfosarcina sp.]|nr:DNA mismatch endonuclease Vsr [Desulfosarcina sp.]MBC2766089.1 DNA mismatch endonuclease Vsr [Desulfosarcina sp.]
MTDTVDRQTRSKMMSAVRSKNTKLETDIRRRLFAKGFRYRIHVRDLPGTPDMVLPKYETVIFVQGCFWHYHGCSRSSIPDSRRNWWRKKLVDNRTRDAKALAELRSNGWRIVVIWECSLRRPGLDRQKALDRVCLRVGNFLRSKSRLIEISGPMPDLTSERQGEA